MLTPLCEEVIPQVGKKVLIVKGSHKGNRALMRAVDMEGFCVTVELEEWAAVHRCIQNDDMYIYIYVSMYIHKHT